MKVFTGFEVPHPNLYPVEQLFRPTDSPQKRIESIVRMTKMLLSHSDRARDSTYHYFFDRMLQGENPVMNFQVRLCLTHSDPSLTLAGDLCLDRRP